MKRCFFIFLLILCLLPYLAWAEEGKPLYAVKDENGLWGYIDCKGKLVIPGTYTWAEDFRGDYALACQFPEGFTPEKDHVGTYDLPDGRWMPPEGLSGIIDTTGQWVLPPEYSDVLSSDESACYAGGQDTGIYWFYGHAEGKPKQGFFDIPSGYFSGLIYDDVELEWTSHMDSELICVEVDDLKGFVRRATGETVIPCQLDPLYRYGFDGDYCAALPADADDPNAWILFDRQGNQVPLPENCFISNGSMVVHCEELIPVRNAESGLYGYIDGTGKLVIPCQYLYAFEFRDGRACVVLNEEEGAEEWAVITPENDIVLRRRGQANSRSGSGYYTHGLLPLGMDADGSVPFVDRDGNEVFRLDIPGLTSIHEFKENGVAFYVAKIDSPGYEHGVGLFNMQGEVLTPPIFLIEESDWYEEFSDGLFPVTEIATLKMGYIDARGQRAFPPVDGYCQEFRDGLARINLYPDVIFVNREGNELYRYAQ